MVLSTVVREGPEALGEVLLTIGADDSLAVDRDGLIALARSRLNPQTLAALAAMDAALALPLRDPPGVALRYDRSALELVLEVTSLGGGDQDVSLRPKSARAEPLAPASLSGYLNLTTRAAHAWETGQSGVSFQADGAVRTMGLVLETEAAWDGPLDSFICPAEARCTYAHDGGVKRRGTRVVSDLPESATRVTFGDVSYWGDALQHGGDLVGVSIRHEPRLFNVNQRLDSATASTLALDAPADVEVLVNGAPIQRLRLKAGTYRLTDLPLTAGSNDVELVVTSDTGERRAVRVTALAHDVMLAPGKSEWVVAGGVPSVERDHERQYAGGGMAMARLRLGVTPWLTAVAHAQADATTAMGGGGVLTLTPFGLWGCSFAASLAGDGLAATGFAGTLSWEHLIAPGSVFGKQTLRAQADYRSPLFLAPGDTAVAQTGVLYPAFVPKLRLTSSWAVQWPDLSATVSARYAFADAAIAVAGAVSTDVDRWGVTLSLTKPLSPSVGATLWTGYGNERLLAFDQPRQPAPELQVGVRLVWRPSTGVQVQAEADSLLRQTLTAADARYGRESNLWTAAAAATASEGRGASLAGSVAYHGRFADAAVSQSASGTDARHIGNAYTTVRTTTSVAFADGAVGVGPAIRDAFVLARPHPSIADSTVLVGEPDDPKASGGRLLPALLPSLPSYALTRLPLDATDLAAGYSLGTAALTVEPPYRAGYIVEVGSDSPLSVYGVLVDAGGRPAALLSGVATPRDKSAPRLAVFTNSLGRFAVEGLCEGEWLISLDTASGHLLYVLPVAKGADALIDAGILAPSVTVEKPDVPSRDVVADAAAAVRR